MVCGFGVRDLEPGGSKPVPITSEMACAMRRFSPDGTQIAVLQRRWQSYNCFLRLGSRAGCAFGEPLAPLRFSADGQWLLVQHLKSSRAPGLWCRACI